MRIDVDGALRPGVTAKDMILGDDRPDRHRRAAPAMRSSSPASAIRALSMEGRMTMCNMSIEAGARAGMIAADDTTIDYLRRPRRSRRREPTGTRRSRAGARCRATRTRRFDTRRRRRCARDRAAGHLGHQPRAWSCRSTAACPTRTSRRPDEREGSRARADLHGPQAGHADRRTSRSTGCSSAPAPTRASRTCARRRPSSRGRQVAANVRAMVVPGSGLVKAQAERKGWTRSSATRASSGASPAARCAWR